MCTDMSVHMSIHLPTHKSTRVSAHMSVYTHVCLHTCLCTCLCLPQVVLVFFRYWTILGLLTSGMAETATGVVRNLLHLVEQHGFVPNGSRAYCQRYLKKSRTASPTATSSSAPFIDVLALAMAVPGERTLLQANTA